jgi:hypothetical protein
MNDPNQSIGHADLIHPITFFLFDHSNSRSLVYRIHLILIYLISHIFLFCVCLCGNTMAAGLEISLSDLSNNNNGVPIGIIKFAIVIR